MTTSEFSVDKEWRANRANATRWVFSHAFQNKLAILGILTGAAGNALLASAQPILIGRAFNAVGESPPDLGGLGTAAMLVAVTQLVRGLLLQLLRNLSAETLG